MIKIKINEIIKQRRLELELTLKDVAKALNVSESTISRYESSEIQNMGIDKIEALSKILKCSPGYLMGWISEKESSNNEGTITDKEKELLSYYNQLNDLGKAKLINDAEDLTHNTKYCNVVELPTKKDNVEEEYIPHTIAAHADGLTKEENMKNIEMVKAFMKSKKNE